MKTSIVFSILIFGIRTPALAPIDNLTPYLINLQPGSELNISQPTRDQKVAASDGIPWSFTELEDHARKSQLIDVDAAGLVQLAYEAVYHDPEKTSICQDYPRVSCENIKNYLRSLKKEAPPIREPAELLEE